MIEKFIQQITIDTSIGKTRLHNPSEDLMRKVNGNKEYQVIK